MSGIKNYGRRLVSVSTEVTAELTDLHAAAHAAGEGEGGFIAWKDLAERALLVLGIKEEITR